jgi:hypothetical protein
LREAEKILEGQRLKTRLKSGSVTSRTESAGDHTDTT